MADHHAQWFQSIREGEHGPLHDFLAVSHNEDGTLNGGSITAGATVTDGTQTTSFKLSATHQTASGGMGLHLSRDVTGRSLMLSLESGGSVVWETTALDATTTDLILAYDPDNGDQLRIRKGAHMLYDLVSGQPSQTHRLQLSTQATGEDTALRNLHYLTSATGSPVTSLIKGAMDGTENFQVTTAGFGAFGMTYTGAVTNGGLEVATATSIVGASVNPEVLLKRTGDVSKSFLFDITSAGTLRLRDNSRGKTILFADTSGNLSLGQDSTTKLGFYGATGVVRAVLATGASHTVDDVITALQNLGLVSQS